jgi:hypothetical protein
MTSAVRKDITRAYRQRIPRVGPELDTFVDECAEYYKLEPREVRKVVAAAQQAYEVEFSSAFRTSAQNVADVAGGGIADALSTLVECLHAERHRVIVSKSGEPSTDENGEFRFVKTPDYATRITAARALIDVHGANAPKQLQIESHVHHHDDTPLADLLAELDGIRAALVASPELSVVAAIEGAPSPGDGPGEDAKGRDGRLLLGNAMHADDRRARQ